MKSLILSNFNAIILLSSSFCRFRGRRFLHGNLCGPRVHFLLLFRTFDAEIPLFGRSSAVLPLRRFPARFLRKIPVVCNRSVSHRHLSRHSSYRFAGKREPAFRAGKTMENRHFPQGKTYFTALKSAMVFPQILFNLLICRFFRLCPRSGRKIPRLTRQYDSLTPCAFSLKLHA